MSGNFLLSLIKLFIAILVLPLICSMTVTFYDHLQAYPDFYETSFLAGLAVFLFLFIFLHQFWRIYEFGQKVITAIFKFAAPFDNVLALIFPFYLILTIGLFYVTKNFFHSNNYDYVFMFFIGFTAAMHVILASQELQEKEDSAIKPTYYVGILFIVFFVILILVFGIDLVRVKWTFPKFYNGTLRAANRMYSFLVQRVLFQK